MNPLFKKILKTPTLIFFTATALSVSAITLAQSTSSGDQRLVYIADLAPLNTKIGVVSPSAAGGTEVVIDGNRIGVALNIQGIAADTPHLVHIHKGTQCPTPANDTNQDGYVDVQEATPATGGILIPFDGSLGTSPHGSTFTPAADSKGVLAYIASAPYNSLLNYLHRATPNLSMGEVTLNNGQNLDLSQTVVEVHGIDPSVKLPSTVKTLPGLTPNQTLPIACGKLIQVAGPATPQPSASPSSSH